MSKEIEYSPTTPLNSGWFGPIATFLNTPAVDWLHTLCRNYQQMYRQRATETQQQAWQDSAAVLRSQLTTLQESCPASGQWTLIFEYELPREGGRRPDLIILGAGAILVLEFKQKAQPAAADVDQVAAYARDLREYHGASRQHPVRPILVLTRRTQDGIQQDEVQILNPLELSTHLHTLATTQSLEGSPLDPQVWLTADYAPLPTVIEAARHIFEQTPLPEIRRAHSAGIPGLMAYLNRLVLQAQHRQERHLVLITGVPGAGKTLVGLQFVYQNPLRSDQPQGVFLSGNGPLISVLQYALKSRVFVQAVRNFYLQYEVRRQSAPPEHLIVFDEAQRAWDIDRMTEKYGIKRAAAGAVLGIAERTPDWCVVLGLIGEGQKIHVGEEDGIEQWNAGLEQAQTDWQVHCAPAQAAYFRAIAPTALHVNELLNLTTSLRSHLAEDLQTWVGHLLAGDLEAAADIMPTLTTAGFDAYITQDLEAAKAYCRDRYQNQPSKRYGLMASSRARNLPRYGIANDYLSTQRLQVGPWYIDPPDSPFSCCALDRVVTEFSGQGLELDFPIVGWGDDLLWNGTTWVSNTRQRQVRNPQQLRLNSYRVLLTRGRDGFIVFVPPDPKLNLTNQALRSAGLRPLP